MVLRILSLLIFLLTVVVNPIGQRMAALIRKTRPEGGYKNRFMKNPNYKPTADSRIHTPKSTTFGVKNIR